MNDAATVFIVFVRFKRFDGLLFPFVRAYFRKENIGIRERSVDMREVHFIHEVGLQTMSVNLSSSNYKRGCVSRFFCIGNRLLYRSKGEGTF